MGEHGEWKVFLPPHAAGCGYQMGISDGEEKITLSDLCVGEVWLAGGQSNMECELAVRQKEDTRYYFVLNYRKKYEAE